MPVIRFPARVEIFFPLRHEYHPIDIGAHTAFNPMVTGACFLGDKTAGA